MHVFSGGVEHQADIMTLLPAAALCYTLEEPRSMDNVRLLLTAMVEQIIAEDDRPANVALLTHAIEGLEFTETELQQWDIHAN